MENYHVHVHTHSRDTSVQAFMAGLQHGSSPADLSKKRLVIGATSLHLDLEKMTEALLAPPNQQDSNCEQPHHLLIR